MGQAEAARAHVERRKLVGPEPHDRHTERLEDLERAREIEHELRAAADDADRVAGDRVQVGGDIRRPLRVAVHTADPAGGHDLDAGLGRDRHRGRDGRRAQAAARQDRRDVAQRDLRDTVLVREPLEQRVVRADDDAPARDRDRPRLRAAVADGPLAGSRGLEVQRAGEAVRDDGRFECDDRAGHQAVRPRE